MNVSEDINPETEQRKLLPFRMAKGITTFSLFWMPARFSTMPEGQREWLVAFMKRLEDKSKEELRLEKLQFMHERTLRRHEALQKAFHGKLHRYAPLLGQSQSLGQPAPLKLGPENKTAFVRKRKNASIEPFLSEGVFRFFQDGGGDFTKIFMGYGGATILLCGGASEAIMPEMQLPPIPKIALPRFLQKYAMLQTMVEGFDPTRPNAVPGFVSDHPAMQPIKTVLGVDLNTHNESNRMDTFGEKSKNIFGKYIQGSVHSDGITFILPRLGSSDFLSQTEDEVRTWFEVFDIYIRESVEDEGIVVASKHNLRPLLIDVIASMREDGYRYWEG